MGPPDCPHCLRRRGRHHLRGCSESGWPRQSVWVLRVALVKAGNHGPRILPRRLRVPPDRRQPAKAVAHATSALVEQHEQDHVVQEVIALTKYFAFALPNDCEVRHVSAFEEQTLPSSINTAKA